MASPQDSAVGVSTIVEHFSNIPAQVDMSTASGVAHGFFNTIRYFIGSVRDNFTRGDITMMAKITTAFGMFFAATTFYFAALLLWAILAICISLLSRSLGVPFAILGVNVQNLIPNALLQKKKQQENVATPGQTSTQIEGWITELRNAIDSLHIVPLENRRGDPARETTNNLGRGIMILLQAIINIMSVMQADYIQRSQDHQQELGSLEGEEEKGGEVDDATSTDESL